MSWSVVFEAPAQAEIAEAFAWYEEKSYGLGGGRSQMFAVADLKAFKKALKTAKGSARVAH